MGLQFDDKKEFIGIESHDLLPLASRDAGIYRIKIDLRRVNSFISTVFVKSGAGTLDVKYYNFTSDGDGTEKQLLPSHETINVTGTALSETKVVSMCNNKPYLEVTTTGTIEFSVYITSASSFPSLAIDENGNVTPLIMNGGKLVVDAQFTPSGLKEGGQVVHPIINEASWTLLTPVPLTNRRAINIQNPSGVFTIKLNYGNAIAGYKGVIVFPNGERQYSLENNILMYAKVEAGGGSLELNVEEIA